MKFFFSLLCSIALMAVLCACNESTTGNPKIGVVDLNKIMRDCEMGKTGLKLIGEQQAKMQAELDNLQDRLEKNPSDEKTMQQLQSLYTSSQQKIQAEAENIVSQIFDNIQTVISDFRQKNNYDILLRQEAVDAYAPHLDVTSAILTEVNKIKLELKSLPATPKEPGPDEKLPEKGQNEPGAN